MELNLKKWAPWNWFKKEQEENRATSSSLPVRRGETLLGRGETLSPFLQLHREVDRLFDEAFRGFGFPSLSWPSLGSEWAGLLRPALDLQETGKQYKISLEIPGVEEKDIQITLEDNVLTVRGEKRQEQEQKDGSFHRIERSYGSFQRSLNLPDDANQDSIKATFRNGVLAITIEKREARASQLGRSIPIEK